MLLIVGPVLPSVCVFLHLLLNYHQSQNSLEFSVPIPEIDDTDGIYDIYVKDNIGYLNCGGNGLHIVDFSDFNNPQTLGSLTDYPYQGYNYGTIYYEISNVNNYTLVGWTSPDEFCVDHFGTAICEPVINYQTYSQQIIKV